MLILLIGGIFSLAFLTSAEIHRCSGLHADFVIKANESAPGGPETLFVTYSFDSTVDLDSNNFEVLKIFNTKYWHLNDDYQIYNLTFFSDIQYRSVFGVLEGNNTFTFVDGSAWLAVYFQRNGFASQHYERIFDSPYFYRGTIFLNDGTIFTPENPCTVVPGLDPYFFDLKFSANLCCNRWQTLPDPAPVDNQCTMFTSNTKFYNSSQTIANYVFDYVYVPQKHFSIQTTLSDDESGADLLYILFSNACSWDEECESRRPDCVCSVRGATENSQFIFYLEANSFGLSNRTQVYAIVGSFESQNGTLVKSDGSAFSPESPCIFYQQGPSMLGKYADEGVFSNTTFCCSGWQNPLPNVTAVPMTTKPPDHCSSYNLTLTTALATQILSTFTANIEALFGLFKINTTYFDSTQTSNFDLYFYSDSSTINNCRGNSSYLPRCASPHANGQSYQFYFSTSFAADGFDTFTLQVLNGRLVEPQVSPGNPCVSMASNYNYPYPPMTMNSTLCCNV